MRLGFYYFLPAMKNQGGIFMSGYFGRFVDCLATHCEELVLFFHLPNPGLNSNFDYQIQSENVKLVTLPPRGSAPESILRSRSFTNIICDYQGSIDALFIRGPASLLPDIAAIVSIPTILLLVGDYLAGVDSLPQPKWRKELIRLFWQKNYRGQLRAISKSLVFVNSKVLYDQFQGKALQLNLTRTTTLEDNDIYIREDTCLSHPIRLLYSGRMDPAKGLLDMVTALAILVKQGEDVVLDMVGWSAKSSNIFDEIQQLATQNDVKNRIFIHGYQPVGPQLFKFYREADIYILASQSSFEGFPRTIWEAMAHSLPVVATKVGSIPDFIEGAAELVNPMKPEELAAGIKHLIHNPQKRQEYISRGLELARQNTLEKQVGDMTQIMKEWLIRQ